MGRADSRPGAARVVTNDRRRGSGRMTGRSPAGILFLQDTGGDEDLHVYAVDIETGNSAT